MKERITILLIITGIVAFLIVFQNYFNTYWATMSIMILMIIYLSYAQLAYTHKARRYRNRNLDNPLYKPFVSVMIPASIASIRMSPVVMCEIAYFSTYGRISRQYTNILPGSRKNRAFLSCMRWFIHLLCTFCWGCFQGWIGFFRCDFQAAR